ncbi:MAG: DUF479 domain-containing protein [Rikenellaceae bacterium]|nr:DUF479 domain-containing protein [Rikenellaceae bacterium]
MNYLAHIFLSGSDPQVRLGNFIGDAVKGAAYRGYPPAMRNGILLHRAIDAYTDTHPAVRSLLHGLKPRFGRYSGMLLDIYFDYLLASRFDVFSAVPLRRFARGFYLSMIRYRHRLPARIRRFMWHFIGTGRLGRYATEAGIRESLSIMVRVRNIDISVDEAMDYLAVHEEELQDVFFPFFAALQAYAAACLHELEQGSISPGGRTVGSARKDSLLP